MSKHTASSVQIRWHGVANARILNETACRFILDVAADAIEQRGRFLIALSGGTTPRNVYRLLCDAATDWSHWHVYFGDERCLPASDPERNSRMAADAWLSHVPVPQVQIHPIETERGVHAATLAYNKTLMDVDDFDLVLLGLGHDGHTASLFPGQNWGVSTKDMDVLPVLEAPRAPAERVSLSAARLSRARSVLFLITGGAKHGAVTLWRNGADIPAAAIHPESGVDVLLESMLLA